MPFIVADSLSEWHSKMAFIRKFQNLYRFIQRFLISLTRETKIVGGLFLVVGISFAFLDKPDLKLDQAYRKTPDEILWQLPATQWNGLDSVEITTAAKTGIYGIIEADDFYFVKGWTFLDQYKDNPNDSICVVLESVSTKKWIIPCYRFGTQDVADFFHSQDLDMSGFGFSLLKSSVENGNYRVGLLFINRQTGTHQLYWLSHWFKVNKAIDPVLFKEPLQNTKKLIFGYYSYVDTLETVHIEGWAFPGSSRCKNCTVSFILKSADATYKVDATLTSRSDLMSFFNDSTLLNSGMEGNIRKTSLPRGVYDFGILLNDTTNGIKYYAETGKRITHGLYDFAAPEPLIYVPEGKDSIRAYIESIREKGDFIEIVGWAFLNGVSTNFTETSIALKSGEDYFGLHISPIPRFDIKDYFSLNYEVNLAGYFVRLRKKDFRPGEYEVCVIMTNKKTNVRSIQGQGAMLQIPWRFKFYGLEYRLLGLNRYLKL